MFLENFVSYTGISGQKQGYGPYEGHQQGSGTWFWYIIMVGWILGWVRKGYVGLIKQALPKG